MFLGVPDKIQKLHRADRESRKFRIVSKCPQRYNAGAFQAERHCRSLLAGEENSY
jgi:hypothetical protein